VKTMANKETEAIVSSTQAYYDGPADQIYRTIWGDNLHLGVPCSDECPHPEAMEHTNEIMAQAVHLTPSTAVTSRQPTSARRNLIWPRNAPPNRVWKTC